MKKLWLLMIGLLLSSVSAEAKGPWSRPELDKAVRQRLERGAIQSSGRVKPFDTFAREGAELLTGRDKFAGRSAVEFILSLVSEAPSWQNVDFLQVSHLALKRDLGLPDPETRKHYTPQEVSHSPRLMALFGELEARQARSEKLDPYFQAVQRLGNQLTFLQQLVGGKLFRFVPPAGDADTWKDLTEINEEQKLRFMLIAATFTSPEAEPRARMLEHTEKFFTLAQAANPARYPSAAAMTREVTFNKLHPFRWAWVSALAAAIFLAFSLGPKAARLWTWAGLSFFGISLLWQIYGFAVRCWIAGRPPVSNMYESILWVAFGCMIFGLVFECIYRRRIMAVAALVFCAISLIVADTASSIFDDGIHPLEPVLRSNLWLTVHVLTITLGYAAFALSMVLANLGVGQFIVLGRESPKLPLNILAFYAYRAVQVGVILLGAGTLLGAVWADYSWGRFWGWDPKETWALIAFLGYMALVHARFRGMVSHFGFLSWCVLAFLLVLMAWYGVNFVLGVGLHSYGFSSGGVGVMATYTAVQLFVVIFAAVLRRRKAA